MTLQMCWEQRWGQTLDLRVAGGQRMGLDK